MASNASLTPPASAPFGTPSSPVAVTVPGTPSSAGVTFQDAELPSAAPGAQKKPPDVGLSFWLQWLLVIAVVAVVTFLIGPPATRLSVINIAGQSWQCNEQTWQCEQVANGSGTYYDSNICAVNCSQQAIYECAQQTWTNSQGFEFSLNNGTCTEAHSTQGYYYPTSPQCTAGCSNTSACLVCNNQVGCTLASGGVSCGDNANNSQTTTYESVPPANEGMQTCTSACQFLSYCSGDGQCVDFGFTDLPPTEANGYTWPSGTGSTTPPMGTVPQQGSCDVAANSEARVVVGYATCIPATATSPPKCGTSTTETAYSTCAEVVSSGTCCTGQFATQCGTSCCATTDKCCQANMTAVCVPGDACSVSGAAGMSPASRLAQCPGSCQVYDPSNCQLYPTTKCFSNCGTCLLGTCVTDTSTIPEAGCPLPNMPCDGAIGKCSLYLLAQGQQCLSPRTFNSTPPPQGDNPLVSNYCPWEGDCPTSQYTTNTWQGGSTCDNANMCWWQYSQDGVDTTSPVLCPCDLQTQSFLNANCGGDASNCPSSACFGGMAN